MLMEQMPEILQKYRAWDRMFYCNISFARLSYNIFVNSDSK
ncbi:Uncharacterised protein [Yersinia intermedia]|nr:Uncharacterised protein [Yersinia intermedia]